MTALRALPMLFLLLLLCGPAAVRAELVWHWEDAFSEAERGRLMAWLAQTHAAVERWAGPYPFDVHLHMHRRDGAGEPVPWANTRRGGSQAIHFHVNPDFATEDFLADWTAPHEFAHLLLPYLGRDNAWAAEGFASYLQYTLMVELGVIDAGEAQRRRDGKMDRAVASLRGDARPLPEAMPSLRSEGRYPAFYWGGAVYWERVDAALAERGTSLQAVLRAFLDCCRLPRRSLGALAATLDAVAGGDPFSSELAVMRASPGCAPRWAP